MTGMSSVWQLADRNLSTCPQIYRLPENYLAFAQLVNGLLTTVCVLAGTVGNLHAVKSVHVAHLDKNRGVVLAVSVLALAIWDTVLLWCAFFYYSLKNLTRAFDNDVVHILTPWFHAFSQIANTASTWCVVAITIQRYRATRDPFRSSRTASGVVLNSLRRNSSVGVLYCSTYRRLFRLPVLLSLSAVIVNLPAFFELYSFRCFKVEEGRPAYTMDLTPLRRSESYRFWYKMLFRMLITSFGPNIFILLVTALTVYLLRSSNRLRRQTFHMSESLLDRYNSRETMQTMISVVLVMKFLLFRSLSSALDVMEVANIHAFSSRTSYYYIVDISNLLIILNSATNCLVFLTASTWINEKIEQRTTVKRKKTYFYQSIRSGPRLELLRRSWKDALRMTDNQLGVRVLYAILRKNPQLFEIFRQPSIAGLAPLLLPFCPKATTDSSSDSPTNEVADRIMNFITEIIDMMQCGQSEQMIIMRIRKVGATHYDRGLSFPSSAWREFKHSTLAIISEVEFETNEEREEALEVWGSFLSFIIREMKMGMWVVGSSSTMPT